MDRRKACSAVGCNNVYESGLSFFRFPRDKERCKKWIMNTRRYDLIGKSVDYLYQTCRLCEQHFEESQFWGTGKTKIIVDAVPTLFGPSTAVSKESTPAPPAPQPKEEVRLWRRQSDDSGTDTPQRQLRKLSSTNGKFMENWNPETSNRETRKMNRKIYSDNTRAVHCHDEKGVHIRSGRDVCDCLDDNCPGCHYPCVKCHSKKCGHECRCGRRWVYDKIEIEGTDIVIKNSLKS